MPATRLSGIFPPVTTPFDTHGEVDYEALARNIEIYNETGLSGYVAFGSNGEAVHLNNRERTKVLETIKAAARPGKILVAGINELSTRAAIESVNHASDCGADIALVVTPYFYKSSMNQTLLNRFFTEVADKSPLPILIYNVPQNTGVVIDSTTIASLASHPKIVGVKDSSGNMGALAETIRRSPKEFSVLVGNGGILFPALMMGAAGAVLAVACLVPAACISLFEAVSRGDHTGARDLQERIGPLSHLVTADLGVAGLKASLDIAGFLGGSPRAPLAAVSQADFNRTKTALIESGLFPALG